VTEAGQQTRGSETRLVFGVAAALYLLGVLRFAWLSDDAFITLRVVDNVTNGLGAVFNEGSRVQPFTHPLWFLFLIPIHLVVPDGYTTLLFASLICAVGLVLVLRWGMKPLAASVALLLLAASYSYLSFSTSGLENPMTYLLIALFAVLWLQNRNPTALWITAGLVVLNRFDLVLLVAPALAASLLQVGLKRLPRLALCLLPLAVWLGLSLIYYGSPFPNTAYAKLNLGIARPQLLAQGVSYLVTSATLDPLLVLLLCIGIPALFFLVVRGRVLAVGSLLYVGYVIWIGGDFMAGRSLTGPATLSAIGLASLIRPQGALGTTSLRTPAVFLLVSFFLAANNVLWSAVAPAPRTECMVPKSGIVDERKCYYEHTGLTQNVRVLKYKTHGYYEKGIKWQNEMRDEVVVSSLIGLAGYAAGPRVTILDPYALADPLLSRIPFAPGRGWRIGHFPRPLPAGYLETQKTGVNTIADPCIHGLYEDVELATKGPLLSVERLRAILRLNFGAHDCDEPELP